jgi:O-antigen ligase
LGLLQWAIFFLSGVDIFPIGGASGQLLRSAISKQDFLFSQQLSLRISSLGGEPKHLAVSLVLALTILAANALANNPLGLSRLLAWVVVSFAGLALLLTQSTQGYILAAVNGALIMVLGRVVGLRPKGRRAVMLIGTIITIGAVVATNPSVQELILHRTTVRFEETGYLEDTNEIAIAWLNDNPTYGIFGVGLGNLQFYAAAYIPDYASEYLTGGIVVAKSGALRVITELGVVGLIILLGTYAPPLVRLSRLSPVSRGTLGSFQLMVAITVLVDFLLVFDGPLFLFAMLGLTHLVVRACEERGRSDPLLVRGRG